MTKLDSAGSPTHLPGLLMKAIVSKKKKNVKPLQRPSEDWGKIAYSWFEIIHKLQLLLTR